MTDDQRQSKESGNPAPLMPWASLRHRDFALYFRAALFINTAQYMRQKQNLYAFSLRLGLFAILESFWLAIPLAGASRSDQLATSGNTANSISASHPGSFAGEDLRVFTIFSRSVNSVEAMEVGFAASLIGAPGALLFGSAVGLFLTLTFWAMRPDLRRFRT